MIRRPLTALVPAALVAAVALLGPGAATADAELGPAAASNPVQTTSNDDGIIACIAIDHVNVGACIRKVDAGETVFEPIARLLGIPYEG